MSIFFWKIKFMSNRKHRKYSVIQQKEKTKEQKVFVEREKSCTFANSFLRFFRVD